MTDVHVLGVQLVLGVATPREGVIATSSREAVVSDSDDLVLAIHDATLDEWKGDLPRAHLRVGIFR